MPKPNLRDEHGIAHLLLIAAGAAVILVVAATGYSVWSNSESSANSMLTGSGSNSAFNNCMKKLNDNKLCQFSIRYTPIGKVAYSGTVVVISPQGQVSNESLQNDGNGNTSITGTSNDQQVSTVILSGNTYVKDGSGTWLEYKAGAADAPAVTDPTANMQISVGAPGYNFSYEGTESCGSLTCYKYLVTQNSNSSQTQYIWFDTNNYQLRQWSINGQSGKVTMQIAYQPETISAPSPVKLAQ